MKLTKEHVDYMRRAIGNASRAPVAAEYLSRGLTHKRWRWDVAHIAGLSEWWCVNVYPYANDEHIDTALRSILGDAWECEVQA